MAQFIKIRETRINVERINHYYAHKSNHILMTRVPNSLVITFGHNDEILFETENTQEFESWLKALGEKQ